ncbi:MAG: hypothetical protein K1X82_06970 [Bacteroidia bacterium]|nr:hypothetical protein [Bacteroidia bacterium]
MNQRIQHIFQPTEHLSQEQLTNYALGQLEGKELHIVESHLIDCSLCEAAVEGAIMLAGQGKKPSPVFLPPPASSRTIYWQSAAAIFIIAFSVGGLLWWNSNNQQQMALETAQPADTMEPRAPAISDGSITKELEKEEEQTGFTRHINKSQPATVDEQSGNSNSLENFSANEDTKSLAETPAEEPLAKNDFQKFIPEVQNSDDVTFSYQPGKEAESSKEALSKTKGKTNGSVREKERKDVAKIPADRIETKEGNNNVKKADSVVNTSLAMEEVLTSGNTTTVVTSSGTSPSFQWDSEVVLPTPEEAYREGLKQYYARNYEAAIKEFEWIENGSNLKGLALYYKAQSAIRLGKFTKAKNALQAILNKKLAESVKAQKTLDSLKASGH